MSTKLKLYTYKHLEEYILIVYELIKYRINNKLKYNNKKGIKKGLTYAYYYKRKKRKILSDEFI